MYLGKQFRRVTGPGNSSSLAEVDRARVTDIPAPGVREGGYAKGFSAGLATDDKEHGTGGQPNGEGEEIHWVMGPCAVLSSPWTERTACALTVAHPKRKGKQCRS